MAGEGSWSSMATGRVALDPLGSAIVVKIEGLLMTLWSSYMSESSVYLYICHISKGVITAKYVGGVVRPPQYNLRLSVYSVISLCRHQTLTRLSLIDIPINCSHDCARNYLSSIGGC